MRLPDDPDERRREDFETAEYVSVEYDTLLVHPVGRGQPTAQAGTEPCAPAASDRVVGTVGYIPVICSWLSEKGTRWNLPLLPVRSALT
jgi:hypothetical protein